MLNYQKAIVCDAEILTEIAHSSKRFWIYTDEQMSLWKEDLTITENYLSNNLVYKVYNENKLIGFYALKFDDSENCYEIDHFWLTPENIKKGFGRHIFKNAVSQLSVLYQTKFFLVAEPNAIGFYEKMNGRKIKSMQSKIPGRTLDIYEFLMN